MRDHSRIPRLSSWTVGVGCLLLLLAFARPAMAVRPVVLDGGDFFKLETIDKANAVIRHIKQTSGKDLMVETYATVPDQMRADYERKGRDVFFNDWLVQRALALKVDGLFILISREPGRLQIRAGAGVRAHL